MSINIGTLDIGVAFAGDTAGLQKAISQAQQGIENFGSSGRRTMRQVREDTKGIEEALARLEGGFKSAVIGSSVAVGLIAIKNRSLEAADAIIQAQVQLDKLNNGFKFGAGGAAGGARELSFVREEANRLGLELGGAATQYMKMVAAARGTNMEGAKTRELFTSIAEASTVMGMSGEQSERAMQAVVQMMSKGKVQAEELRGQLGEHLPGAFAIAARAMGVTEVELNKLMETGQVLSADFLPKFAAQLRNELGGSVEDATKSMQASLNRFETAWLTFKQNVAQTGIAKVMGGEISAISDAITASSDAMDIARKSGATGFMQAMSGIGNAIGRVGFDTLSGSFNVVNGTLNTASLGALRLKTNIDLLPDAFRTSAQQVQLMGQKIVQAEAEYAMLSERLKQAPENIYIKSELTALARYIAELERARDARDNLAGGDARQRTGSVSESRISAISDAEYTKAQQAKGLAYAKLMGDMATPQEKLTEAIFKAKQELGELYSPEIEARLRQNFIKPTREAKEKLDDFTKSAQRGQKLFGDLTATEGGLSGDFAEKWGELSAAYAKTYINAEQLLAAQAALLKLQPFYKKGLDEEKEAAKEQAKATAEAAKAYDAYYDAVQKNADTLQGNIQTENAAAAAIGLSPIAIAELEAAKLQDMAASKERAALTWESIDLSGEMTANLRAEAKALRDLAAAKVNRAVKDTAYDEAKKAAEAWQKASEQIEKDITDALMRGFESGKGFAEVFRDTVANMFKTLVLRPVVQATVQGGLNAIGLGGAGGAGGVMGAASNGISLYNAGSSAMGWLGLSGAAAGTGITAAAGTGLTLASTAGTGLGLTAGAGTGLSLAAGSTGLGISASSAGASALGAGSGAMSSLAAAAPWALGALAVIALIKSLDDSGTAHTGGSAMADMVDGIKEVESASIGFNLAIEDVSKSTVKASKTMAGSALDILKGLDSLTGGNNKFSVATGFADDSSKDGSWGNLAITKNGQSIVDWRDTQTSRWAPKEFADGDAGAKQYGDAVAAGIKQAIDTLDLPDWADNIVKRLGESPSLDDLTAAMQQIQAMPEQMLNAIGTSSQALGNMIYEGMQASDPVGAGKAVADQITYGIEASLYNGFSSTITSIISTQLVTPVISAMQAGATLTEAMSKASIETMKTQVAAAGAAFAAIVNDPGFKDALASINTLIADTVSGAVGGNNAPLAPDVYEPLKAPEKDKVTAESSTGKTILEGLLEEEKRLRIQEAQVFGDTAEEIKLLTAGMTDFEREVFMSNRSLSENIAIQQRVNALKGEEKSLQVELLQAQGKTADALALITEEMAPAERAQYLYNETIRDQINAIEKAQQVADERLGLEGQLLQAQEDTAGLRALELAALDPSNRALQTQIWALEDLADAAKEGAKLIEELAQALPSTIAKFLNPEQNATSGYRGIAQSLIDAGLTDLQVDDVAAGLVATTKDLFAAAAVEIYNAAGTTDEMRLAILKASSTFADLKDAEAAAAEAFADERAGLETTLFGLLGDTVRLRERELAALNVNNRAYQQHIYALQDEAALIGARADTAGKYQSVVSAEKQARDGITAGYLQAADALQAINERAANSLRDLAKNLRDFVQGIDASEAGGLGPAERLAAAQANFAIAKAQAMAGDTGAQGKLTGLAGSVLDLSLQTAASKVDYLRTVGLLKADLNAAATAADAQAGAATPVEDELLAAQKEVAKWSAAAAESGAATTKAVTDYAEEWRKANADLATANKALSDVGISALALNVKQPITELIESIGALSKQMALTASTNPGSSTVAELTGAIASGTSTGGISGTGGVGGAMERASVGSLRELWSLGQSLVSSATDYTNAQIQSDPVLRAAFGLGYGNATGQTAQLYAAMKADNPAYNDLGTWLDKNVDKSTGRIQVSDGAYLTLYDPTKLPALDVGTNFVPRDMIAQVHQGEMIVPAAYNPATSGVGNAEMVAEIRALRAEVAELRKSNTAENAAIAGTSLRTAKVLERVTPDGDAIATRTAEAIA